MDTDQVRIPTGEQLTMSDVAWEQARERAGVIGALASRDPVGIAAADEAAAELGVSRRQIYVLLDRFRRGSGVVTDTVVSRSAGGRGGNRLPEQVENIIHGAVRKRFLTRQKRSVAVLCREIARECVSKGLPAPSRNGQVPWSGVTVL